MKKKIIVGLLVLVLLIAGSIGVGLVSQKTGSQAKSDKELRKQLADTSVVEVSVTGEINVTSPLEVNGEKVITGNGTLLTTGKFGETEIEAMLLLANESNVTIKDSVTIDATGIECGVYVNENAELTLEGEAVLTNATKANIYSLGTLTQKGASLENGYDNVYLAKGANFLWEKGNNYYSVKHGIHVEEGATLKTISDDALMREAGAQGIYLQGEAVIDDILLVKSVGIQIDVTKTGVLTINGGQIVYGNSHGVSNQGKLTMNGGSINNSGYCGLINSGETEMKAGTILNNTGIGIVNKTGGRLIVVNKEANISSNSSGVCNEEKAYCELAYASIVANKANNLTNFGDAYVHDIELKNSGSNCINSAFKALTVLKNVVIDGTASNNGILCSSGSLVEMENVAINNVAKRGVHCTDGTIKGSHVSFDGAGKAAISSCVNARTGGGLIELKHVSVKNAVGNSIIMEEIGAGKVVITDGVLGATQSNNLSIKAGEVVLNDVHIQGHAKGFGEGAHAVYVKAGDITMNDCKITDSKGSAIRTAGGTVKATGLSVDRISVHNVFASGGETIIKNSTLAPSDYHHIYCKGGEVKIEGSVLKQGVASTVSVPTGGKVTVANSSLEATTGNNINITGGQVILKNTEVLGNMPECTEATHGVYLTGGKISIENSCVSNTSGAALRNNGGYVEAVNLSVKNIKSHNIFASAGDTIIKDSTLAISDFHHVYCKGGTVTLEKCTLEEGAQSTLSVPAGGTVTAIESNLGATKANNVTVTGGTVNLNKSSVLGNVEGSTEATHGIYVTKGNVNITDSAINSTSGAAIRNAGGVVRATGLTVDKIKSHNVFASAGTTELKNSTLEPSDFHHIYCKGGEVLLDNCYLKAGVQCGLSIPTGGTVTACNTVFGATSANNITITGGTVNLINSQVLGNLDTCTTSIHGVYLTAGTMNIEDSSIRHTTGNAIRTKGGNVNIDGLAVSDIGILSAGAHVVTTAASSSGVCGKVTIKGLKLGENCLTKANRYAFVSESKDCYSIIGDSSMTAGKDNLLVCNLAGTVVLEDGLELYGVGRAIYNAGNMTIENVHIHNNGDKELGIERATAIWNEGTLTINDGEFDHNYAREKSVIENKATLTINGGRFHDNESQLGGALVIHEGAKGSINGGHFYDNKAESGKAILVYKGELRLKGLVKSEEINLSEGVVLLLDGALKDGSSVVLHPQTSVNGVVAKSSTAEDMSTNMNYLILSDDLDEESLILSVDTNDSKQVVLKEDLTSRKVARIGTEEYYTLQEAVDAMVSAGTRKAVIELIRNVYLASPITIPEGYDITIKDDGEKLRTIKHSGTWSSEVAMFAVGTGSTLTFASTSTDDTSPMLALDGSNTSVSSRLVHIPTNVTVNIGKGVEVSAYNNTSLVGGVFEVTGGTLTITGGVFNGNVANYAGVISAKSGTVTITGATFKNNKANKDAGVFLAYYDKNDAVTKDVPITLTMENVTFLSNGAGNCGGVLNVQRDKIMYVTITGCTFDSCSAASGGAIDYRSNKADSFLTLTGNTFEKNTASTKGGAIFLANAVQNVTLKNNNFTENTSLGKDLASYTANTEIILSGKNTLDAYFDTLPLIKLAEDFDASSKITLSYATSLGEGTVIVTCSSPEQATQTVGCFVLSGYVLNVSDNKLVSKLYVEGVAKIGERKYDSLAEAVAAASTTGSTEIELLADIMLSAPITTPDGSNIIIKDDGKAARTISYASDWAVDAPMFAVGAGSTLSFVSTGTDAAPMLILDGSNTSKSSRLVNVTTGITVNLGTGVKVSGYNNASLSGGVFDVTGGTLVISGGVYEGNKAKTGGVIAADYGTVTIIGGTFKSNQASDDAGVLYITAIYNNKVEKVTLVIQNAKFISNSAADCGGVVNVLKNRIITATITGCTFESCTAATGGAIDYRSGWNTSSLDISDNSFKNNTSSSLGGAIILVNTVYSVSLKDNDFEGNASPGGKDLSVYTKNSDVTLSGSNSLDVYFTGFSTLKLAEDFDTSSKITVAYQTAPAKGTAIVKCSNASLATNALGSFTLTGDNLKEFGMTANGNDLVLVDKSILTLLLSLID